MITTDIRIIMFDLDGTLLDSHYDWPKIRADIGVPHGTIVDYIAQLTGKARQKAQNKLIAYEEEAAGSAPLVPGAADLLTYAKGRGLKTALVTNNSLATAKRVIERFGFEFDVIVTRDDGFWKPYPEPIFHVLVMMQLTPHQAVLIGDGDMDIAAAKRAGVFCIRLLRYGKGLRAEEADIDVHSLREVIELLDNLLPPRIGTDKA